MGVDATADEPAPLSGVVVVTDVTVTSPPVEAAATEVSTDAEDPVHGLANCTKDRVTVTSGARSLRLSPLGTSTVKAADIDTFALRDLADQQVVRIDGPRAKADEIDAGLIFGIAVWPVIFYLVGLSSIETKPLKLLFGFGVPAAALLAVLIGLAIFKKRMTYVAHGASLVLVVLLGAGLPVTSALVFGDLDGLLDDRPSPELFGRLAQTLFIIIASVVPTLLYFLFDRQRVLTIRNNFQQEILRLDPAVATLYDVEAKYGDQLAEAVGRDASHSRRIVRSNRFAIFLATTLIVLGWLVTLPVLEPGAPEASNISAFLTPNRATYVFGFLGAYYFAISLIARRYVRGDLRPKSYGTITVRILTVFVLAWMLDIAFEPGDQLYLMAFVVGILPETFFTLVAEARRAFLGKIAAAMREPHPLTNLEGIDLYDRARLQDEGVNNVEALAHHDLIDLMLGTRIPVPRLIDWVDQAVLYLHTVDADGKPVRRNDLRRHGIRTASDLCTAGESPELWAILVKEHGESLNLVLASIRDDEWMENILLWRKAVRPGERRFGVVGGHAVPDPAG